MSATISFRLPKDLLPHPRRLLLVFDGGNAPGYSSAAVALTEEGERHGFEVWAATEGFRSLTEDARLDPRFERLIVGRGKRYELLSQGIPVRSMGRRVQDAGSDFRSERYRTFIEPAKHDEAAHTIRDQGFSHVIGVGGNGTFAGIQALSAKLGDDAAMGFINVSVDNDVGGDRAIGFFSGVETGAAIARGLFEDAYTHKRIYLLEMMGNRSGRHALHCGVAARANLIVLPRFSFSDDLLTAIAHRLDKVDFALVVVAEGYERKIRKALDNHPSASHYLRSQLAARGLEDRADRRVIAEPFSRYLRGVRPSFADVSVAFLKASLLFDAFEQRKTNVMPYVLAAHDVGVRAFDEIATNNRVERAFLPLLDRLGVPGFQDFIERNFADPGSDQPASVSALTTSGGA